jgi:glycerophosphoryl diester phosphodiesterase
MKYVKHLFFALLVAVTSICYSCSEDEVDPLGEWTPKEDDEQTEIPEPGELANRVIAHRGACTEFGLPDNSIAGLRKAIEIGCYGSECDIYVTKDDKVVVAHATSGCLINGLRPWEHTLAEIRAAGKLSNGETVPDLGQYIDVVLEGGTTQLWLDVKNITINDSSTEAGREASAWVCEKACEVIVEKGAQKLCVFVVTGNNTAISSSNPTTIWKRCLAAANTAGIKAGWMNFSAPSTYASNGYGWLNSTTENFYYNGKLINRNGYSIESYTNLGIEVSVFNADTEADMNYYLGYKDKLSGISTNYPAKLISMW